VNLSHKQPSPRRKPSENAWLEEKNKKNRCGDSVSVTRVKRKEQRA
jgi:hypothetical protein